MPIGACSVVMLVVPNLEEALEIRFRAVMFLLTSFRALFVLPLGAAKYA